MKISTNLTRGLTEEQQQNLEQLIKNSVLAKQLRAWLLKEIANTEVREEQLVSDGIEMLAAQVGERRGYRHVLNLLPEE